MGHTEGTLVLCVFDRLEPPEILYCMICTVMQYIYCCTSCQVRGVEMIREQKICDCGGGAGGQGGGSWCGNNDREGAAGLTATVDCTAETGKVKTAGNNC